MGKNRIKTVRAGRMVVAACYSQALAVDAPAERAAKSKLSSAARQKLNFKASWQKLELLLAANFEPWDCWVTLTYDDAHLPADRKAAQAVMRKYVARLRKHLAKRRQELRYVYNTETLGLDDDHDKRLHHHMVCTRCDIEALESLWGNGHVDVQRLLASDAESYEARARYLVKERNPDVKGRRVGDRGWSASRNLRQPETASELVPDTVIVTAPPGAVILDRAETNNDYGRFINIKYLLPRRRLRI